MNIHITPLKGITAEAPRIVKLPSAISFGEIQSATSSTHLESRNRAFINPTFRLQSRLFITRDK